MLAEQLILENKSLREQLYKAESEIDRLHNELNILQEQLEQRSGNL